MIEPQQWARLEGTLSVQMGEGIRVVGVEGVGSLTSPEWK